MKKLFLLDAYALIFRAYYALIKMPRITQSGFNTSAIFGFVNTLEELIRKENPTHIAVCFDPPGPTFRNEAYDQYKAERAATPEDIKLSVPYIKEIVKAYNIPVVEVVGYEADDVIGTIAKMAEKENFETYMMTPDKDYGQLVGPNVYQYKPSYRGQDFEIRGEKEVCEHYGINRTSQIIDLLALMGDKVDNIPGCPGVGEKTAVKIIEQFDSVENLLEHTDELKGALKKKVEENAEQIKFSKYLATIRTDVPVEIKPDDLIVKAIDSEKLFSIFRELEFKSLIQRVERRLNISDKLSESSQKTKPQTASPSLFDNIEDSVNSSESEISEGLFAEKTELSNCDYKIVKEKENLEELKKEVLSSKQCGIYLMSEGENDMMSRWTGSAISTAEGKSFFIPINYSEGTSFVLQLLEDEAKEKVTCNAKRDYVIASRERKDGKEPLHNFYDISLSHYVLQPEMHHGLESLSSSYLNYDMRPYPGKTTTRRGIKIISTELDTIDQATAEWACEQADVSLRLRNIIEQEVEKSGMETLLKEVEMPLVRVLAEMELTGVRIDTEALSQAETEMEQRISTLERNIHDLAGIEFNVSSPSKVGEILFDRLLLDPKAKKTKSGQYSTSEEVLEKLITKHPIVGKIMEYRALKKLLSTYITALPAAINPATGRVHTNYNQTVTATGRLSSSAPNLQNIPVRDNEGREIRRAFIAEPGCIFLSADYSQIELRLLADFSRDEIMLDAFRNNKDIHAITAANIYHKELREVTSDERRHAKTANFGIIYGISAFGLASRLGIARTDAKNIIDNYFATFPTIQEYMTKSVENAKEKGYVETRMGRRRMLADINSRNPVVRGYAERNAINAPLQGTAADIIKVAMIRIYAEMQRLGLKSKMIMQVHDELNFSVPEEELATMQEIVSREMENAYQGEVTLTASVGIGNNWLDAH